MIYNFSTPNMSLIYQAMPEKSGVSKLSWTAGHPVDYIKSRITAKLIKIVGQLTNNLADYPGGFQDR